MSAESDTKNVWLWILGTTILVVALLFIFNDLINRFIASPAERGQFGDQFGAMNALFSGLAFFGLILTIAFQAHDLKLQRKDLKLQTEALQLQIQEFREQRIELARSAKSQEQSNILNLTSMKIHLGNMHLEMDLERIKMMGDVGDRLKNIEIIEDRIEQSYKELHQLEELLGLNVPDNGDHSDPTTKA